MRLPPHGTSEILHLLASLVQINTVAVGVAIGQSCMLLSAGTKGHWFMLPHATGSSIMSLTSAVFCGVWWPREGR
jgi:hypothetical protein